MIVEKPWGKVTTYTLNQTASVRMITIDAGQTTSEHYHQLRDEMWVVLDSGLTVQICSEPERLLVKAILVPAGLKLGSRSYHCALIGDRLVWLVPSAFMIQRIGNQR